MSCFKCDEWEKEALSSDADHDITSMTCPICDRTFVSTQRTANLVRGMGPDWWKKSRDRHAAEREGGNTE